MPASSAYGPYTFLIVLKPLPVLSGPSASWFNQPDGGMQFKTKLSVQELIDENFIEIYNR
ncbi:TNT domain-containing protein [Rhizobium metallidurans]|uniref:TNT domain-containing protein n=1 Tax=Rhizobium metallidurans TaxID=1265931 RepID=UPI0016084412